jgi:hypothetical protein
MKKILLFVLSIAISMFAVCAAEATILTDREAGKVAFSDWTSRNGQVMIPEYGLRVENVELQNETTYVVRLSIYDTTTRQKLYDVAEYQINGDSGKVIKFGNVRESVTPSVQMVSSLSQKAKHAADTGNEAELRKAIDQMETVSRGTALVIGLDLRSGDASRLAELATIVQKATKPEIYAPLVRQVVLVAKSRMIGAQLSQEALDAIEILNQFC